MLVSEDSAEPRPAGPAERQQFFQGRRERPVPGRWGSGQRSTHFRRAVERQNGQPPDAGQVDDAEVERQVREQLYGAGFRRR